MFPEQNWMNLAHRLHLYETNPRRYLAYNISDGNEGADWVVSWGGEGDAAAGAAVPGLIKTTNKKQTNVEWSP